MSYNEKPYVPYGTSEERSLESGPERMTSRPSRDGDRADLDFDSESQTKGPVHSAPVLEHMEHAPHADHLRRSLTARQVQMIAIGGTIGTGLFLGTGKSLSTGGPASMLIAYAIVGAIVYVTMLALGEMSAFIPVAGSFCSFAG
jgi:AAT family amino acid transporter